MRVSLIGFMGTGKSIVGKLLAPELGVGYLDTDQLIEEREGRSIPEIFDREGEDYFRELETEVLTEILHNREHFVLSTGGGIVLASKNRRLLKSGTFPVLLEAAPTVIYNRIKGDQHRPLLNVEDPLQEIRQLLTVRHQYYHEFKYALDTGNRSPEEIVDLIQEKLKEEGLINEQ